MFKFWARKISQGRSLPRECPSVGEDRIRLWISLCNTLHPLYTGVAKRTGASIPKQKGEPWQALVGVLATARQQLPARPGTAVVGR
jgi:hypothetical protein